MSGQWSIWDRLLLAALLAVGVALIVTSVILAQEGRL